MKKRKIKKMPIIILLLIIIGIVGVVVINPFNKTIKNSDSKVTDKKKVRVWL